MTSSDAAKLVWIVAAFLGIVAFGLRTPRSFPLPEAEPNEMIDAGSWYSREQWPHDGRPFESEHFVVYSDAASPAARKSVARICEEILDELTADFGIIPELMFRFPHGQEKIHIYAYKEYYPQSWGARGYYAGLIIWSLDHTERSRNLGNYKRVVKHELVHVVEALLKGRDTAHTPVSIRVHMWYSEGLAEAISGGTSGPVVRSLEDLNRLTEEYGRVSPVGYRTDADVGDYSDPDMIRAYVDYVYPMNQLAVEYLIDPVGLGKSPHDAIAVFTDIADGMTFAEAFTSRFGMTLEEYDERFFELMDDYLPELESTDVAKRVSLLGTLLAAGALLLLFAAQLF